MSLIPLLFSDHLDYRPSRIVNQQFGLGLDLDDFFTPVTPTYRRPQAGNPYIRRWLPATAQGDAGSTVTFDKDKFQVNLDVQHFSPEEITVKAGNGTVTVEGKHEEKEDEHGYISRHFVRTYRLPKGHDVEKIESQLSSDGVLTVTAPIKENAIEQKTIPIENTGKPAKKAVETKKEVKKAEVKETKKEEVKETKKEEVKETKK